jgi:uncharacterized DUF497 family protein
MRRPGSIGTKPTPNTLLVGSEDRWTSIGHTDRLRVLKLVWTLRGDIVRVITALDASKNEAREYLQAKGIAL